MLVNILPFLVLPMLTISIGLLIIVYYSKKKAETEFEKEIKDLRKLQVSGKLDKKTFFNIKNRMNVEKLSSEQGAILEKMFKEQKIDSTTYLRLRKALKISLNQKFKKLNSNI
jgi:hypothetical protein